MPISLEFRRDNIAWMIGRDPCSIEVRRPGRTADDAETTFTFTGRVAPAGSVGGTGTSVPLEIRGENGATRYASVLVAPWNTPDIKYMDELIVTHAASGIVRYFRVAEPRHLAWKWEVMLEERT